MLFDSSISGLLRAQPRQFSPASKVIATVVDRQRWATLLRKAHFLRRGEASRRNCSVASEDFGNAGATKRADWGSGSSGTESADQPSQVALHPSGWVVVAAGNDERSEAQRAPLSGARWLRWSQPMEDQCPQYIDLRTNSRPRIATHVKNFGHIVTSATKNLMQLSYLSCSARG